MIISQPSWPCVLYVENNEEDRALFRMTHRQVQPRFHFETVESVQDAIYYLSGQPPFSNRQRFPFPALVVLDYSLSPGKGTDLLRWLRQRDESRNLPVAMFSDDQFATAIDECYQAGASYFIDKGTSLDNLRALMRCLDRCFSTHAPNFDALQTLKQYRPAPRLAFCSGGAHLSCGIP